MAKLNTEKIKQDFPIFNQKINDETLVYLDNAATSQIPKFVEEKVRDFNEKERKCPSRSPCIRLKSY